MTYQADLYQYLWHLSLQFFLAKYLTSPHLTSSPPNTHNSINWSNESANYVNLSFLQKIQKQKEVSEDLKK